MKAVRFHRHGGPEVLQYEDAPDPVPNADEALVRVKACALNHLDLWARNGLPNVEIPLPHISGSDVSGVVEWVPEEEKEFHKGDEVVMNPGVSCGRCEKCLLGLDNQCRFYTIIGYGADGGYAELVKIPRTNLVRKPEGMSFEEAASYPLVSLTAYHMLVTKARLLAGETVLVLGAGSGVGSAAIQVAKAFGAEVIATAGGSEKLAKARSLGADHVIDHYSQNVLDEVRKITGKKGVDVVVEHVGKSTWEGSVKALAKGGRLVLCGATTGAEVTTDLRYVYNRELTIYGSFMASRGELLTVTKLYRTHQLRPVVDSVFPLHKAADAQKRMEGSEHFGKIVLKV
ncbi:MAG TPA: zinc-binding dehydrogenase [Nitrososphaerales archaeon]|nr:zinc-binding dehydrogenase [Nitrososphaerales archaeon]